MKNKHTKIDNLDLRKLVNLIDMPIKDFTKVLQDFYKLFWSNGKYWVKISPQDSIELFYTLESIIYSPKEDSHKRYNAYRLIGISLKQAKIMMDIFEDIIILIERTYADNNWNIRMQAYHFFCDVLFYITLGVIEPCYWKKETKKMRERRDIIVPRLILFYKKVLEKEQKREDEIYEKWNFERKDQREFMPHSWDTPDTILKACRRIIERFDCPYYFHIFQDYDYTMLWSCEFQHEDQDIYERISPEEYEEDLQAYIEFHELDISLEKIKSLVFQDDGTIDSFKIFSEYFFDAFDRKNKDLSQKDLDFITVAWTVFPHSCLWWKSPQDML